MITSTNRQQIASLLITLWDGTINKSELIRKAKKKSEAVKNYQTLIDDLVQDGMIEAVSGRTIKLTLLEPGKRFLKNLLCDPDFKFTSQIGKRSANVLLAIIRSQDSEVEANFDKKPGDVNQTFSISSYNAFQEVMLKEFEVLNQELNLGNLVPIYKMRKVIGERVERKDFDSWLLEMQANNIVQLIGGEMPGLTPEMAEESIKTALGASRYYIKRF